jgi:HAD superfamily hydrolase (TIGR01509 family)
VKRISSPNPVAVVFDLDGTLVDSVYQHVIAWHEALRAVGIELPVWKIHRRIGMSGGLFVAGIIRETKCSVTDPARMSRLHADIFAARAAQITPLPGARELLDALDENRTPWAIATSGVAETARPMLSLLGRGSDAPFVARDQVRHAKPDPDLFIAAANLIGAQGDTVVVGDSVWDILAARRAGALPVGLLTGGYGRDELERAGAFRVYNDPADLLDRLDEIGVRHPL